MKKALKIFSITVICLFTLSLFGWIVFHITEEDKNFGFLTGPVKFMYSFPDLFSQSVEEVKTLPKTFMPTPVDFESVNKLDSDFIVLITYSDTSDSRTVALVNLMNDSVLHKWALLNPYLERDRIIHPILLPDNSLVYSFFTVSGIKRIDSLGNLIWAQDSIHSNHAMNLNSQGDIWLCSTEPVFYATGLYKLNGRSVFFTDNCITKVNAETGRIMFHKSITELLNENNLSGYLLRSMNTKDPIHINDVEPALKTTRYYKEDDVFISLRNISMILHYRPSENRLINIIEGPFTSQHDVDFFSDSKLAIFNNNFYTLLTEDSRDPPRDSSRLVIAGNFYSNIALYDFRTKSISFFGDSIFRANEIYTATEGLVDFVSPSTYLVEEQNSGLIWIIKDNQVVYKNVYRSQYEGYHHLPNWTRVIRTDV